MQGATVVAMAVLNEAVAAFAIKDPIKPEASAVIRALKKGGIKVGDISLWRPDFYGVDADIRSQFREGMEGSQN